MKFHEFNAPSDKVSANYSSSIGLLNAEHKPSVKKNGRPGWSVGCKRHGLAVPGAGGRSYVTGSIRGWSRSRLTYLTGDS